MPIRWAAGDVPLWEVGVSMLLMVVVVVALIRVAGRIYAGAVLRSGPRVKIKDALAAGRQDERAAAGV
jgi:ABC-2 type transport system permease protein